MKKQSIPVILLCVLALAWRTANNYIPELYRDATIEAMVMEAKEAYEAEREAAYKTMVETYANDLNEYEENLRQFEKEKSIYEQHLIEFASISEEYEANYAAELKKYEADAIAYDKAVAKREAAYQAAYAAAEKAILQKGIVFTVYASSSLDYNNHVGNDWSYSRKVNNTEVDYNSSITLKLGNSVSICSVAIEDDSIPDVGSASGSYRPTTDDFRSGFIVTQTVTVRENRGRYSGNTAGFVFTYEFTPQPFTVMVDSSSLPEVPGKPIKPAYNPPDDTEPAPVEPVEPVMPTTRDIPIIEPDYDAIDPTRQQIISHNPIAQFLIFSLFGITAIVALLLSRWFLREKAATERKALETEIERLHDDFYAPIPENDGHQLFQVSKFSCEEEKRLNYRFWAFLALNDQLKEEESRYSVLIGKRQHKYLQYFTDAKTGLENQIETCGEKISILQNQMNCRKDPLQHFPALGSEPTIEKQLPWLSTVFQGSSGVTELDQFFELSKVSFFNSSESVPIIFTGCYIVKYYKETCFLEILPFDRLSIDYREEQKTTNKIPDFTAVDVIRTSWLHTTKSGKPDRRYSFNPATFAIYDGIITLSLCNRSLDLHFGRKAAANSAMSKLVNYRDARRVKNNCILNLLNMPYKEYPIV